MKKNIVPWIYAFIAIAFYCHFTIQQSAFDKLSSLQGVWIMPTKKGLLVEAWTRLRKDELTSKSFIVSGADTVLLEQVRLVKEGNDIFYIPTVEDQNNKQPVSFKLVNEDGQKFVFENLMHDYPQQIIYNFVTSDSVIARIEGNKNGKSMGSNYYFKKQLQ